MSLQRDVEVLRSIPLFSKIEPAKLNAVDPQACLADVLARIADHPARRIDDFLPWRFAPSQRTANLAR